MCNIAGYIGDKPAAPILIEMIKNQSGFCGGYYTGITTLYNGKLYTAKVVGDVDRLLSLTNAINFPGNIGIIHSRSNSGGDYNWAHPFNSYDDKLSTVFNGSQGAYVKVDGHASLEKEINSLDVPFKSATEKKQGTYPLRKGKCVSVTESLCHITKKYIEDGLNTHLALRKALLTYPSEMVGLAVNLDEPNKISFVNNNMSMFISKTQTEIMLSSMALAFPKDRKYLTIEKIPHSSSGEISIEKTSFEKFEGPLEIGEITNEIKFNAKTIMIDALKKTDKPLRVGDFNKLIKPLFKYKVSQHFPVVYEVLRELLDKNLIDVVKTVYGGADEVKKDGIKTTQFSVKLK